MECYPIAKRTPIRHEKPDQQTAAVVSFVVCSHVLIGVYTINIPEIFQPFKIF